MFLTQRDPNMYVGLLKEGRLSSALEREAAELGLGDCVVAGHEELGYFLMTISDDFGDNFLIMHPLGRTIGECDTALERLQMEGDCVSFDTDEELDEFLDQEQKRMQKALELYNFDIHQEIEFQMLFAQALLAKRLVHGTEPYTEYIH